MFRYRLVIRAINIVILIFVAGTVFADDRKWKSLSDDGIHDSNSPAIDVLQQPKEALSRLPTETSGNMVNWAKAVDQGIINPRNHANSKTKVKIRNTKVYMKQTGEMPIVLFPHKQHTLWLDCKNCHEKLFKSKAGSNNINMFKILSGQFCGQCHGSVAFPLTECNRCHSVPRKRVN